MKLFSAIGLLLLTLASSSCDPARVKFQATEERLNDVEPHLSLQIVYVGKVPDDSVQSTDGVWQDYEATFSNNSQFEVYLTTTSLFRIRGYEFAGEGNQAGYSYSSETYLELPRKVWHQNSAWSGGHTERKSISPGQKVVFHVKAPSELQGKPVEGSEIRFKCYVYADLDDRNGRRIASNPLPFPPN